MAVLLSNDKFISAAYSFTWTFAKTMPQCPHEYIVRGKTADDDTYFAMFRAIEERGVWREWNGTPQQYLHPGDGYYYWKMTNDINESTIINRAKEKEMLSDEVLKVLESEWIQAPKDENGEETWGFELKHGAPEDVAKEFDNFLRASAALAKLEHADVKEERKWNPYCR